jgi:flavin reductase (DIM6/NTAB) family NADH-FMN oxidoreductase RutF
MRKKSLPLSKVYTLIEPGPVVLLTTAHAGQSNVMTMSWQTMLEFEPPLIGCVVSNRNHSYDLLQASGACVINLPAVELASQVVGCGNSSGRRTDKFKRFGLTPVPASLVEAPLIEECFASLECRVVDTTMVNTYGLFVLQVFKAWATSGWKDARTIHHLGHGNFMVAGERIRLPLRMK